MLFIFLINSSILQPISITSGVRHIEEIQTCYKFLIILSPPHKTVTTLPCEIRKSYFSTLQQYDYVRNVTDKLFSNN